MLKRLIHKDASRSEHIFSRVHGTLVSYQYTFVPVFLLQIYYSGGLMLWEVAGDLVAER